MSPKQEAFVREYLVDLNATQAAIRAGYSAKTAHSCGPRLLENAGVKAAIAVKRKKVYAKIELTVQNIAREIARVAMSDKRQYVNEDGTFKAIHELDDDAAAAMASVKTEMRGRGKKRKAVVTQIKLHDKVAALNLAARHLGMFKVDNEQAGTAAGRTIAEWMARPNEARRRLKPGGGT